MSINYNDSRFTELEKEESQAKQQSNSTYDSLINQSSGYYNDLVNQSKEWADKQADIQKQQTEFTVQKIEQQKEQAAKDYTKEQKAAYQDYMQQVNPYGATLQGAGTKGLAGSGWSEDAQASFYNAYQGRYAQARESYNEIVMNYNNNIKEAELQNSSALATIYANAQKEQLELALQNFTVIKDLSLAKQNAYLQLDSEYNDRWRQVESQINTENALAEEIRQYNATLAEQKRQADLDYQYKQAALAEEKRQFDKQYNTQYNTQYGSSNVLTENNNNNKTKTGTYNTGKYSTLKSTPANNKNYSITNTSSSKGASTQAYNNYLKTARTWYMTARTNKANAAETYVASLLASNKINQKQAASILKSLGLK